MINIARLAGRQTNIDRTISNIGGKGLGDWSEGCASFAENIEIGQHSRAFKLNIEFTLVRPRPTIRAPIEFGKV